MSENIETKQNQSQELIKVSKEKLRRQFQMKSWLCSVLSSLLTIIVILILFFISTSIQAQPRANDADTFTKDGISERRINITEGLSKLNDEVFKPLRISYQLTDTGYFFVLDKPLSKVRKGYNSYYVYADKFKAFLNFIENYESNSKVKITDLQMEHTKRIMFNPTPFNMTLITITVVFFLVVIRYFILLASHYNARANALLLIDNKKEFTVEEALALTSVSHLDFRISKYLKNEVLELSKLINEKKKIESGVKDERCCCCQSRVTGPSLAGKG